jgi:hypothetical protein
MALSSLFGTFMKNRRGLPVMAPWARSDVVYRA